MARSTEKINLAKSVLAEIKTKANACARSNYCGKATEIIKGNKLEATSMTDFGYRKNTTDEYVPNAYMQKFGWKNCYYQSAECVVSIPEILWKKADKWEKFLVSCPDYTKRTISIFGGMLIEGE